MGKCLDDGAGEQREGAVRQALGDLGLDRHDTLLLREEASGAAVPGRQPRERTWAPPRPDPAEDELAEAGHEWSVLDRGDGAHHVNDHPTDRRRLVGELPLRRSDLPAIEHGPFVTSLREL